MKVALRDLALLSSSFGTGMRGETLRATFADFDRDVRRAAERISREVLISEFLFRGGRR